MNFIGLIWFFVGLLIGLLFMRYRRNRERKRWSQWQEERLEQIASYENTYRFKKGKVNGALVQFATFDGGKRWYQISTEVDGLHIFLSPNQEASAILTQDLSIKNALSRGLVL